MPYITHESPYNYNRRTRFWHCGCCSLKSGCRLGAIWTMLEALMGIALLVASGLLGRANITALAATCYFVVVFCAAWVLLAGIFREVPTILFIWCFIYTIFLLIRIILLGFVVAAYSQYYDRKKVSYEIIYLSDGTALSEAEQEHIDGYMSALVGVIAGLGISIIVSAWILIGVIYLGVGLRRMMWRKARLEY